MLFKRPSIDHHDFCASIIVLVYMTGRFPLFFNAAPCAIHPGQKWLFKDLSVDVSINRNEVPGILVFNSAVYVSYVKLGALLIPYSWCMMHMLH